MNVIVCIAALAFLMFVAYRGFSVILFAPVAALGAVLLTDPTLVPPTFTARRVPSTLASDVLEQVSELDVLLKVATEINRIDIYKHAGYFAPSTADQLKATASASNVVHPTEVLTRFVELFARA